MADLREQLRSVTIQKDSDEPGKVAIYHQDPETGARGQKLAGGFEDGQAARTWIHVNGAKKDSVRNE